MPSSSLLGCLHWCPEHTGLSRNIPWLFPCDRWSGINSVLLSLSLVFGMLICKCLSFPKLSLTSVLCLNSEVFALLYWDEHTSLEPNPHWWRSQRLSPVLAASSPCGLAPLFIVQGLTHTSLPGAGLASLLPVLPFTVCGSLGNKLYGQLG